MFFLELFSEGMIFVDGSLMFFVEFGSLMFFFEMFGFEFFFSLLKKS